MNVVLDRYKDELRRIPASGGGGCHPALLRVANFGRIAGVDRDQVAQDLAAHVHGARKVTRAEIATAVNKAFDIASGKAPYARARIAVQMPSLDGAKLLNSIVERGAGFDDLKLWEKSPVRIDWPPERDSTEVLRSLYLPEDKLFIGARYDADVEHILPASEWIDRFESGNAIPEYIVPNPLTGEQRGTKDGKPSYRADSCVAQFRFAVVEFDSIPLETQIQFWAGAPLPVVVLIDSGGKSIHGWVRIDAASADEWVRRVEVKLFALLTAVGVDGACRNEARLSRTPGRYRSEKKHWQRVLYLDPAGRPVIS